MLALTFVPAEIWRAPIDDKVYEGFDANLIYTTGPVVLTQDVLDARAVADSVTTINLVTTQRQRLTAAIDVSVLGNLGAAEPFRIGLWSPWTDTGYFLAFGPAPSDQITAERVSGGTAGPTLIGGSVASIAISRYELGQRYRVSLLVDRAAGIIRASVASGAVVASASLTKSASPALFGSVPVSLTASSDAGKGATRVILRNYSLTLPHERVWTSMVDDPVAKGVAIALGALGALSICLAVVSGWRWPVIATSRWRRITWLALGGAGLYFAGNVALFALGGHPFDFANERLYGYVAQAYGPTQLYFVPGLTALAGNWNGVPWVESEFPYSPLIAYVFGAIGWLGGGLFGGGALLSPTSVQLGYVIKLVNVAFGLADGALIYFILRGLSVSERWSRIGTAFFVLNPAVWFSTSVWGQTHVISIFFVLLAVLFAQRRMPFWAWLALIAACLTRPQMAVFGLLLGLAFLKNFTWQENLAGLSWATVVTFIGLLPLTLATSPSLPVDVTLHNILVQGGVGSQAVQNTVSESAYSVWPLVTYVFHGASGMHRAYTPSANLLIGTVTYQAASQILTLLAMLLLAGAIVSRKRASIESGGYLPLVAVGVASFLMLLTGVVATHFLLALPLLLLCRRWMDPIAYVSVAVIWSISTLVPMYGDMGTVVSGSAYPLLAPAYNPVTRFFVELYSWDRFITVAIVANICAVIWVAILAYRPAPTPRIGAAAIAG